MVDRYAGYDVLDKWDTPSWNAKTREVVQERLALAEHSTSLTAKQIDTLRAVVARIAPQPDRRAPANTVALLLRKIDGDAGDGYRHHALPRVRECWRRGLDAVEAEAQVCHGKAFAQLSGADADDVLRSIEQGETRATAWNGLPPRIFWNWRLLPDVIAAHWAHPSLWSEMGFGGPAGPRGYVRLAANMRDGWEAKERTDG